MILFCRDRWSGRAIALLPIVVSACDAASSLQRGIVPEALPPVVPRAIPETVDAEEAARQRALGLQLRQQERFEAAIAALERAANLDARNLNGWILLGWTQHLAGDAAAAARSLRTALQLDGESVEALNALGIVYLVGGDLERAIATHAKAARLAPRNPIPHYNLSLAFIGAGRYDDAIARARRAAELEPQNPHPQVALALAHWRKGDRENAQRAYGEAIALDSRYRERWFLAYLQAAGFSPRQIEMVEEIRRQR